MALAKALILEQDDVARRMVLSGKNVNVPSKYDKLPPLLVVCNRIPPDFEMIKFLLRHGANVQCRDSAGDTPLHAVSFSAVKYEIPELLFSHGADPNVVNTNKDDRGTPLFQLLHDSFFDLMNLDKLEKLLYLYFENGALADYKILLNKWFAGKTDGNEAKWVLQRSNQNENTLKRLWHIVSAEIAWLRHQGLLAPAKIKYFRENGLEVELDKCQAQLKLMTTAAFFDDVTFMQFFSMDYGELMSYARNKAFVQAFTTTDRGRRFPNYSKRLAFRLDYAIRRLKLVDKRTEVLANILAEFIRRKCRFDGRHSATIVQKVVPYLNEYDMRRFT